MVRRLALLVGLLAACAPRVTVRTTASRGEVVFEYRGDAREVFLAGTMTGWRAVPLQRSGGRFELVLTLHPGRYEYRLEVVDAAGRHPSIPQDAERADDGFGGENGVLRVP